MATNKVLKGSTKRKIKVFAILLTCSFAAWFISQLSETYTDKVTFDLIYTRLPDSLMLMGASHKEATLTVRGSGWQFLGSRFSSKNLNISLEKVYYNGVRYYLREQDYRQQLSSVLPGDMSIVQIDADTLFFDFSRLVKKKVPVIPDIHLELAQNYLLEQQPRVFPDSVVLIGPAQELDTVREIRTVLLELTGLSDSFERMLLLDKPAALANTNMGVSEVQVRGEVFRFSEKILDIPVEVIGLPAGTQIRTFPDKVEVLCKARLETLKEISPSDFRIVVNLEEMQENSAFLPVHLEHQPEGIPSIQLLQQQVEYILKRE